MGKWKGNAEMKTEINGGSTVGNASSTRKTDEFEAIA